MTRIQSTRLLVLALLIGLLAACARPEESPPRVVVVLSGDARLDRLNGLQAGLGDLGYVDGENITLEIHNANNDRELLAQLVDEAVASQPDLVVVLGGIEAEQAKNATSGSELPVVFVCADSSVQRGLVNSLERSGNNLTGIDSNYTGLIPKRLETFTRLLPDARRVLVYYMETISAGVRGAEAAEEAGRQLRLEIHLVPLQTIDELGPLADGLQPGDADAIFLVPSAPIVNALPDVLAPAALRAGIPIFSLDRDLVTRGVLAAQGPGLYETGRQGARLVDKVLRGTPPGDIPIELPAQVELVVNLDTAERLSITIPDEVLALATEVIPSGGGE